MTRRAGRDNGPRIAAHNLFGRSGNGPAGRSRPYLLLLIALSVPPCYAGGSDFPACRGDRTLSSCPQAGESQTTAPQPIAADRQRPISFKALIPNVASDQKSIWLFPARAVRGEHWKPAFAFVLATAGMVALDPHDTPYFRRTTTFTEFNRVMSGRNTAIATFVPPLTAYIIGRARKNTYAEQTALLAGEAVADVQIVTLVMKNIDRRLRPRDIPPGGDFSHTWFKSNSSIIGGGQSFPSGHTTAAFAVATVFAERYRRHRWVPWVAYGLAGAIGFSRVTLQAHFPSDVFAGAVLGIAVSHYVVLRR